MNRVDRGISLACPVDIGGSFVVGHIGRKSSKFAASRSVTDTSQVQLHVDFSLYGHKLERNGFRTSSRVVLIFGAEMTNDRVRNELTSRSIESIGQAVGVRSNRRYRRITFGIGMGACRTVVPATYPATRGYRCHWDAEAGVLYLIAGKSAVWDEGRLLLVSKDTDGKLVTIESRQAMGLF